jgi:carbon monoxide dehydrogenase subunit G
LNDPAVLQRCLPGCDTFAPDGENKFRVAMQAAVGPVRARFAGKLQLLDVIAPSSYALAFEGSGGVAGFGKGTAEVALDDAGTGTRLRYVAKATVGGRLAQVGARLIDGVTKRMADDFFTRFVRELGTGQAGVAAASAGAVVDAPAAVTLHAPAPSPVAAAPVVAPTPAATAAPVAHPSQATQIAVIAAAVSATAAAVAVLAALFALRVAG